MRRADVLAVVDHQFNEIRKQLDIQLKRTAQLQIDTHFKCTKDVQEQLAPTSRLTRFATRFLQAGGDIYVLSNLLGHSSVSITERHYAHVVDADIIARARQIRLPSPEGVAEGATQSATPARRRRAS